MSAQRVRTSTFRMREKRSMGPRSPGNPHRTNAAGASRVVAPVVAVLALFLLAGPAMGEENAKAAPALPAGGAESVEIASSASSWDNLSDLFLGNTPAAPFGEGSMFVMRGELRNTGKRPVRYVVLRYELLDDQGKVVKDIEGYNRNAESMRPDEEGKVHAEKVTPIPAGGTDSYRMVFFHDEVPRFASQRVRVTEVHE
jgi:hypothetical protein